MAAIVERKLLPRLWFIRRHLRRRERRWRHVRQGKSVKNRRLTRGSGGREKLFERKIYGDGSAAASRSPLFD
jgi:hypothetical protein